MTRSVFAFSFAALMALSTVAEAQGQRGLPTNNPFVSAKSDKQGRSATVQNWSDGYFEATGYGTSKKTNNPVQMENMAMEAARIMAQVRLVELLEGVSIQSIAAVRDLVLDKQLVKAKVQGSVQGAVTVDSKVEWREIPGSGSFPQGKVTLRVCLKNADPACVKYGGGRKGVYQALGKTAITVPKNVYAPVTIAADATPVEASAVKAEASSTAYTGLILDLDGLEYLPSLDPRIVTNNGQVVYSAGLLKRKSLIKHGAVQLAASVSDAGKLEHLGANPLVVVVDDIDDDNNLIITLADAEKVAAANVAGGEFLKSAKVAIAAGE